MTELKCGRCDHKWVSRVSYSPARCPKCKSPYWNKERVRPVPKKVEVKG